MRPCGTRRLRGERSAGGRHHGTAHRDVADDGLVLTATVTIGDVVSTEIGIFDARGGHNMAFYGGRCRCGVETIVTGSSLRRHDGRVSQGSVGRRWSHDSSRWKLTSPRSGRSCGQTQSCGRADRKYGPAVGLGAETRRVPCPDRESAWADRGPRQKRRLKVVPLMTDPETITFGSLSSAASVTSWRRFRPSSAFTRTSRHRQA
jgi:hypothetical protein